MKMYHVLIGIISLIGVVFSNVSAESQIIRNTLKLKTALGGTAIYISDRTPSKLESRFRAALDLTDAMTLVGDVMHKYFLLSDLDATFEVPTLLFAKIGQETSNPKHTDQIHKFTAEFMQLEPKDIPNKRYKISTSQPQKFKVYQVRCRIKAPDYDHFQIIYGKVSYHVHAPCDNHVRYGMVIKIEFSTRSKNNEVTYAVDFGHYDVFDYEKENLRPLVSSAQPTIIKLER